MIPHKQRFSGAKLLATTISALALLGHAPCATACEAALAPANDGTNVSSVSNAVTTTVVSQTSIEADRKKVRPRIGVALGGGGTRGAAHIGVLRVLEREGIPIDVVTGTSMGSVVGGLYSAGVSVNEIEHEFTRPVIMKNYMTVPLAARLMVVPIFLLPRAFGWHPYDGFYFGNKFRRHIESCLPAGKKNFEDLDIKFGAMAVNLTDLKPFPLTTGSIADAVQASSAIPILRRPVPYGESALLVDGAMKNNLPVDEARSLGADLVIAVPVSERVEPVERDSFRKIGSVARRMEQLFLASSDEPQMDQADVVIHPLVDGIKILSTNKYDAMRAISAGEQAAEQCIPEIRKKLAAMGVALASTKIVAPKDVTGE